MALGHITCNNKAKLQRISNQVQTLYLVEWKVFLLEGCFASLWHGLRYFENCAEKL